MICTYLDTYTKMKLFKSEIKGVNKGHAGNGVRAFLNYPVKENPFPY